MTPLFCVDHTAAMLALLMAGVVAALTTQKAEQFEEADAESHEQLQLGRMNSAAMHWL